MKKQIDFSDSVCIIGGGASGLMAACVASEMGKSVVLFEKNQSQKQLPEESFFDNAYLGKKLLITGKGRCNLTNDCTREEFMKNVPRNGKFLFAAYSAFPSEAVMQWFEQRGLELKTERGNRVFPCSDKALSVLRTLKKQLRDGGVKIINKKITDICAQDGAVCHLVDEEGSIYLCKKAIVCTGGLSYPITGSDGDGMRFAQKLGHTVISPAPSLVPLTSDGNMCKRLQGLSLRNVTLTLKNHDGKKIYSELGEMLFTHFGISGPLVLSASAHIEGNPADYGISIDLKPALDEKTLDERLLSDFSNNQNRDYKNVLSLLLPAKLIPVFAQMSGIPDDAKVNSITKKQRAQIISLLKAFPVEISGFRPISEAIITRGGIKTSEINPSTMQSKIISGLYFAGEIIDTDAYTGGFNLQIAFCTAFLAAKNA